MTSKYAPPVIPCEQPQALDTNTIYVIIEPIYYIKNILYIVYRLYNNVY